MKINPIYIVLAIALLGISFYVNVKQHFAVNDGKDREELLSKNQNKQARIITRYIASDSTQHVIYKEVYAKSDAEKELAISTTYVDSLKKALNVKTSQVDELTRFKATVSATVKTAAKTDSLGNKTFYSTGKWLSFTLNTSDSLFKYKYNVELTDTKYHRGNWLTGRTWYRDVFLSDPNAIINGIDRFTIPPERRRRLGLGLQVGYYYDLNTAKFIPAFGVGLSYNLLNF